MKTTKRILAVVLCFSVLAAIGLTAFAADAPSSWAENQVTAAIAAQLVPTSLQSSYTQATTRAEFCALAVALYENIRSEVTGRKNFTDTNDVNVEKAAYIGVVYGTNEEGTIFSPNSQLTREQAAVMLSGLANAVTQPFEKKSSTFSDNGEISPWALEAVGQVQAAGIMSGVGNNIFSPKAPYTREQSIVTIFRMFDFVRPVTVTVSTPEEFFKALASNTIIQMNPGVYNLSSLEQKSFNSKQVYWQEEFDGNELCLEGIQNLTIKGIGDSPSELIIDPRYAFVLRFTNSTNIKISNIKAGHTEGGYCLGGVFSFDLCEDIQIDNTHMYGCGTEGLNLNRVQNMSVTNSSIYECTSYIMTLNICKNIRFETCVFRNNGDYDLININVTSDFLIDNCEFRENSSQIFSVSVSENIVVKNSKFISNESGLGNIDQIVFENNFIDDSNT